MVRHALPSVDLEMTTGMAITPAILTVALVSAGQIITEAGASDIAGLQSCMHVIEMMGLGYALRASQIQQITVEKVSFDHALFYS